MPFCESCYAEVRIGEASCPQCGASQPLWWKECGLRGVYQDRAALNSAIPQASGYPSSVPPPPPKQVDEQPEEITGEDQIESDPIENFETLDIEDLQLQVSRLMERANERFEAGRAWLGSKNRAKARKEFERAFNYFGEILKLDPSNAIAREYRAKCLQKIC